MKQPAVRRTLTAVAVAVSAAVVIGVQDGSYMRLTAGPALPASATLEISDPVAGNPDATDPLVTTVAAEELTNAEAAWCAIRSGCATIAIPADDPGFDSGTGQMDAAVRDAQMAAAYLGDDAAPWPAAPGAVSSDGSIKGPSAGLAYTLYLLNQRSTGDLFADRTVAATGTVDPDGDVGAVGGVALKAVGARAAGAGVFFVPRYQTTDVPRSLDLTVVGVENVTDAVDWLCDHGATSGLCPQRR